MLRARDEDKVNSYYHAVSCVNKWGGVPEDYLDIHTFIDSSKQWVGDVRHRTFYHNTAGVFLCERLFGTTIKTSPGRIVPVRLIAERHVLEDLGWIPSPGDFIKNMNLNVWMGGKQTKRLEFSELTKGAKNP